MAEAAHPRVTTEPPHPRMNEPPHPSNPHVLSTDDESLEPAGGCEFIARSYQLELFEQAKKQNSILVLGTGSGKTFISVLLIKELAEQIRGSLSSGSKRTVFVVNTVPLVYQQALSIETHTGLRVGKYEGSMAVDYWTVDQVSYYCNTAGMKVELLL
ncbi:endoribonuclease Dicer-like isoform X2 [Cherax quadricarinatus]